MANEVNVVIKEDNSVQKAIKKTAKDLQEKYSKKRNINEKLLKPRKPWQKVLSGFTTGICVALVAFCVLMFISVINCQIQGLPTSFAGYSTLTVVSPSMTKSGFPIGARVISKAVDPKTLKDNDIIAFYTTRKETVNTENWEQVDPKTISNTKSKVSFAQFFGTQNSSIKAHASKKNSIIFHHIRHVYKDVTTGKLWFTTYGSSNVDPAGEGIDTEWYVSEDDILGAYDGSGFAKMLSGLLTFGSTKMGLILIILIPILLLGLSLLKDLARDVQKAKLELDIVEEKRKLTDDICVRNNIGFRMDNKTKYKVLAQAEPNEKMKYVSLLWKQGQVPNNIQKYYMRKELMLKPNERLLAVNRICEERYKNGDNMEEVAKYYMEEKAKIKADALTQERAIRELHKQHDMAAAQKLEEEKMQQEQPAAESVSKKDLKKDKLAAKTSTTKKTTSKTVANKRTTTKSAATKTTNKTNKKTEN